MSRCFHPRLGEMTNLLHSAHDNPGLPFRESACEIVGGTEALIIPQMAPMDAGNVALCVLNDDGRSHTLEAENRERGREIRWRVGNVVCQLMDEPGVVILNLA
jgi:hypothetical protein